MTGKLAHGGQGPRPRRVRHLLALAMSGALATLAACGGGGSGSDGEGGGGPATLTVGVIPIADVAPLYVGIDQGFFEEENLTIETQLAQGGAAIVPSVQSGDYQIGFSNTTSLIIAASEGLPVRIVSQGVQEAGTPEESWSHIWVPEDSDIEEPADLEGKTVSLNTLKNITEVTARRSLEKHGVDHSQVDFVEVPFPEANQALEQGDVDAIYVVEPFDTVARQSGAREIVAPLYETQPNLTVGTYFTTQQYIADNQEVVERFVRAMNRSLEFSAENPDEVRRILPTYTEIPEDLIADVRLAQWSTDLNRPSIELVSELSQKYGLIEEQPNMDELIWTPDESN